MTDAPQAPPSTTWRQWTALGVLTATLFMAALDMTVVFLAIPEIAADLRPGPTQQLWVLQVGDLLGAGLVLTAARLAERFGARRMLAVGVVLYGAASASAALSSSVEMLIGARGVLGAATVIFTPAGMVLIRQMFPDGRRFATAVGIYMAGFSGGMALGPPVGGVLLSAFGWQAIFLVNVPVAVAVVAALRLLPVGPGSERGRIDLLSAALSVLAVGLVLLGVQEAATAGPELVDLAAVVVGAAAAALFVRRQRRLEDPLLDLSLFRRPAFAFSLVGIVGVIVATVGAEMQISQHLQIALGLSAGEAGLLLGVPAAMAMVGTVVGPALLRWLTPAQVLTGGVLLAASGTLGVAVVAGLDGGTGVAAVIAAASVAELGAGPMFGLGAGLIAASVPREKVASGSAVQDVSGGLGNSLGIALGGTVAYVVYQSVLSARIPDRLDGGSRDAATDSPGAAVAVARDLGGVVGRDLDEAARAALGTATQSLYLLAAVLLTVLAVVLWRGLRGLDAADIDAGETDAAETDASDVGVAEIDAT